jgi:hypothetical protein
MMLESVAQVALADRPRSICWYGDIEPAVLQTMIAASPGAELFFINPWPEGPSDRLPFHPASLSGHVHGWGFQGWARVVQGDPATALQRLAASSIGDPQIELGWAAAEAPDAIIRGIASRLAPGGVLLLLAPQGHPAVVARVRELTPGCETRVLGTSGLMAATRKTDMPQRIETAVETTVQKPENEQALGLRVVFDMLLRDKALGLVEPETLAWDQPFLVIRSAHMGRMEAFFHQVATRCTAPRLHVLSHARDEEALHTLAPFPFTFHAWTTPGAYRLENMPAPLLERLRAERFATLFFLDQGTNGDRLDEVERLLAAIKPEPIVCFMGNGKFAQAPDAEQRRLAETAFLRLIEWYQFRLDPGGATLASAEPAPAGSGQTR